jgi:beta-lactamase regulating signal transducer with metallopeptidase domain
LHSTIVLCGAWLLSRWPWFRSDWLIERTWKTAAAAGLLAAPLSVLCSFSQPIWRVTTGETAEWSSVALNFRVDSPRVSGDALPVTGEYAAGVAFDSEKIAATGRLEPTPQTQHDPFRNTAPIARRPVGEVAVVPGARIAAEPLAATPDRVSNRMHLVIRTALLAAATIAGIGLLRMATRELRLRRRLARCQAPGAGRASAALSRVLRKSASRRRVRLLVSDEFAEPVACGLFHGTIILPRKLESQTSHGELEALLAHEVAHLLRGDTHWLFFGRLLCACLPFQPINFVARRAWRQAEEFLCDQWAVRHGANGLALANCLTVIAEKRMHAGRETTGVAVSGDGSSLSRRVERLVQGTPDEDAALRPLPSASIGLISAMLVAALGVWGPQGRAAVDETLKSESAAAPHESMYTAAPEIEGQLAGEFALLQEDWRRAEPLLNQLQSSQAEELVQQLRRRMDDLVRRMTEQGFDNPP